MKRTIEVEDTGTVYYGGKCLGYLLARIGNRFGISYTRKAKYAVTITEGTQFGLEPDFAGDIWIIENGKKLRWMCGKQFTRLFFKPDGRKRYDITVKKVK